MSLICKQKATRMIRAANAVERSQGRAWDQNDWFEKLLVAVEVGSSYAVSSNTDLNKLDLFIVSALVNGLQYQQEQSESGQAEGDEGDQSVGTEQASGQATPIARPGFLPDDGQNREPLSSRVDEGRRMDVDPEVPVREQPETSPRPRADSAQNCHSVRSELREEKDEFLGT